MAPQRSRLAVGADNAEGGAVGQQRGEIGSPPSAVGRAAPDGPATDPPPRRVGWVHRLLSSSLYLIAVAVVGLILAAATLILYGAAAAVVTVVEAVTDGGIGTDGVKQLTVDFLQLTDAFLLGAVLLIVAIGLYELFIEPDLPVPAWLKVRDLDELKGKLIGVITVLLAVTFLPHVVDWDGRATILQAGLAVAAVITALALLTYVGGKGGDGAG